MATSRPALPALRHLAALTGRTRETVSYVGHHGTPSGVWIVSADVRPLPHAERWSTAAFTWGRREPRSGGVVELAAALLQHDTGHPACRSSAAQLAGDVLELLPPSGFVLSEAVLRLWSDLWDLRPRERRRRVRQALLTTEGRPSSGSGRRRHPG